jgi:hypothetical protein
MKKIALLIEIKLKMWIQVHLATKLTTVDVFR